MLTLAAFTLLLAGACALSANTVTTMMQDLKVSSKLPPPCCSPPTWQAELVDLKSPYQVDSLIAVDYSKNMEGVITTSRATGQVIGRSLIDYSKHLIYEAVYVPDMAPTCKKVPFNMPLARCMNDTTITDLVYLGSSTLGMKGAGLNYDGYSFKAADNEISIALVPIPNSGNLCYPVIESLKNKQQDSIYIFLQAESKVNDPTIFDVPAPCV
ncbi:hypothetical protein EGW08_001340 [Elysia chlorotica]|uniref:Uncharacterized protein n=1 Tax=Elysia chlorotica TaxID=188477 RepID=A0A3S1A0S6_ELYCH|nr:hypothetical protein EGW08_001340 [Elysia chlorotica]